VELLADRAQFLLPAEEFGRPEHWPAAWSRLPIRHNGSRTTYMRWPSSRPGSSTPVPGGNAIGWFGGAASAFGWMADYLMIPIGSAIAASAVWSAIESYPR
jgi:hypothetical protein